MLRLFLIFYISHDILYLIPIRFQEYRDLEQSTLMVDQVEWPHNP